MWTPRPTLLTHHTPHTSRLSCRAVRSNALTSVNLQPNFLQNEAMHLSSFSVGSIRISKLNIMMKIHYFKHTHHINHANPTIIITGSGNGRSCVRHAIPINQMGIKKACTKLMMTSSNGSIFCVTGHLCGEFTGHRWIPRTKASDAELW